MAKIMIITLECKSDEVEVLKIKAYPNILIMMKYVQQMWSILLRNKQHIAAHLSCNIIVKLVFSLIFDDFVSRIFNQDCIYATINIDENSIP